MLNIVKYAFNEYNAHHHWIADWAVIRRHLVEGKDRKKYFEKIEDYDGCVEEEDEDEDEEKAEEKDSNKSPLELAI